MMKKPNKVPLYRVEIERMERPDQFQETDADHCLTVSTFTDVTPWQVLQLYMSLEDDGRTTVEVFRQTAPVGSPGYELPTKLVFSGYPGESLSELME